MYKILPYIKKVGSFVKDVSVFIYKSSKFILVNVVYKEIKLDISYLKLHTLDFFVDLSLINLSLLVYWGVFNSCLTYFNIKIIEMTFTRVLLLPLNVIFVTLFVNDLDYNLIISKDSFLSLKLFIKVIIVKYLYKIIIISISILVGSQLDCSQIILTALVNRSPSFLQSILTNTVIESLILSLIKSLEFSLKKNVTGIFILFISNFLHYKFNFYNKNTNTIESLEIELKFHQFKYKEGVDRYNNYKNVKI